MADAEIVTPEPVPYLTLFLTKAEAEWVKAVANAVDGDGNKNRIDLDVWQAIEDAGVATNRHALDNYSVTTSKFGLLGTY